MFDVSLSHPHNTQLIIVESCPVTYIIIRTISYINNSLNLFIAIYLIPPLNRHELFNHPCSCWLPFLIVVVVFLLCISAGLLCRCYSVPCSMLFIWMVSRYVWAVCIWPVKELSSLKLSRIRSRNGSFRFTTQNKPNIIAYILEDIWMFVVFLLRKRSMPWFVRCSNNNKLCDQHNIQVIHIFPVFVCCFVAIPSTLLLFLLMFILSYLGIETVFYFISNIYVLFLLGDINV